MHRRFLALSLVCWYGNNTRHNADATRLHIVLFVAECPMVLLMFQHIFVRHALTHYVTVMSGDSAGYDANTPCIPQHAAVFVAQCLTVLDVSSLLRLRYATCRRHDDVICNRKPQWRQIQAYTLPSIGAQTRSHVPDDARICTDLFRLVGTGVPWQNL